jgi:putative ABC transport system substrate-binding protein
MNRRDSLLALLALGSAPLGGLAQQASRARRVGFLYFGSRQSALDSGRIDAFAQGMRALGYVAGGNFVLEERYGDGKVQRLPLLAAELVKAGVELIVATGTPTYRAIQQASPTMPVVITVSPDPVRDGWAASLAHPGGMFTGLSSTADDPGPKHLELLMAALPKMTRVAVLLNPNNPGHPSQLVKIMTAAQKFGIRTVVAQADTVQGIGREFAMIARERGQAAIILNDTFFVDQVREIAAQALKHRVASIGAIYEHANAGGLMIYGPDLVENFRRAPLWVDKILKGASAGQLPIEQPSKYLFVINLKTANTLGIAIPQSLRLRADRVIE